ncbi:MAG TPA: hypothetical protein VF222_04735 [Nitrososphaeraceae archaeon]
MIISKYIKKISITILLTSFAIICGGVGSLVFENSFAHNFSPDESAHFLTLVDKIKVESSLVANSSGNNNQSSAIEHAEYALNNYDTHTNDEISERNERVANELNSTLHQLLDQVQSSNDKSQISQSVETINAILEEATSVRIDQEQLNNSTIQALVFANIVNSALQSYGTAFNIGIDLTNMSNLHTKSMENNTLHKEGNNHEFQNVSHKTIIENFSSYESAISFSDYTLKKFKNEIKTSVTENNTTTQNYLKKLEDGLLELNTVIKNKDNPMKAMEIVHTKIHPNLQILFNLKSK